MNRYTRSICTALALSVGTCLPLSSHAAEPGSGAPGQTKPPSGPHEVSIGFNVFLPEVLTVPVGTTVTWKNNDGSNHHVFFSDSVKSGRMRHDAVWTRTFTMPGTYDYRCAIHGDVMKGKVVVQ